MFQDVLVCPDREMLRELYKTSPDKITDKTADEFVSDIAWRLFDDFCRLHIDDWQAPHNYNGEAYDEWIAAEIRNEIKRRTAGPPNKTTPLSDLEQSTAQVKIDVLRAVIARAVEFFSSPKKNSNLRASLEPYIRRSV